MKFKVKKTEDALGIPQYVIISRLPFHSLDFKIIKGKLRLKYNGFRRVYGSTNFFGCGYSFAKTVYHSREIAEDVCANLNYIYGL